MLGSQALETAIGLALLFTIVSTGASTIVETIARVLGKRAKNLEAGIAAMFGGSAKDEPGVSQAMAWFKGTSVYTAAAAAVGKTLLRRTPRSPSYLSAKSFADAVSEMLVDDSGETLRPLSDLPPNLRKRLQSLAHDAQGDLLAVKSGLEQWFDETMERAQGAYKRWATSVLFAVGLLLAVAGNISTTNVAEQLWQSPVTRQAVVDAADKVVKEGSPPKDLAKVAATTRSLQQLSLPVGWSPASRATWTGAHWWPWNWTWKQASTVAGWLITALLTMLGGPFWFDLLSKLVSLRSSGAKPSPATDDPASATTARGVGAQSGSALSLRPSPGTTGTASTEARLAQALGVGVPEH